MIKLKTVSVKIFYIFIAIILISACSPIKKISEIETSISGTKWKYIDKDWTYEITFNSDGSISSTHPNDKSPDNDKWIQNGLQIEIYFNDGYSKYFGKMQSLNKIKGTGSSSSGQWKWTLKRIKK
ncbi:hypothetical protein ACE1ET_17645 [Saccharicrinis sp. FJH62]|uniref:hypothetical protein n=1 Tax=Saccharicrinis sp. FJH62 TaxID=3344657 RepID=UPI0035D51725